MNQVNLSLHIGYTSLGFLKLHKPGLPRYTWITILVISSPNQTNLLLKCRETDISVLPC